MSTYITPQIRIKQLQPRLLQGSTSEPKQETQDVTFGVTTNPTWGIERVEL